MNMIHIEAFYAIKVFGAHSIDMPNINLVLVFLFSLFVISFLINIMLLFSKIRFN